MPPRSRHIAGALFAISLLAAPGCDRLFDKSSKDEVAGAQKKAAAGDFRGAALLYEASLDGTAKTAESHYKLALLYADKLKSPLASIHHLDRYLDLAPNGAHATDAKNLRKADETKLRLELGDGAPVTQTEAVRLRNENQMLRETVAGLRSQKPPPSASIVKGVPEKKPIPPGSRTYTVKNGDTLAKIAREFYKSSARAKDIQDANFNQLGGTVKIKPGMVLIIPK